ncbi:MAG: cyclic nucleotide-binding domain-containing protein [Acidobacteria bacterium]|nr:cyclic nucleotide-binding domain-containing protein [Acidobacteriota bacterium]
MKAGFARWFSWAKDQELSRRVEILSQSPVFVGLPSAFLGRLSAKLFEKSYEAGDEVFHEGEPGRGLFVVWEGEVHLVAGDDAAVLATLGPGSSFGELALLDEMPRSATARVVARSRLLILYRSDFEALVEADRALTLIVMRNLLRMLSAYVRRTNLQLAELRAAVPAP